MATDLKVTYRDVEVEYDEAANKWRFELRGRERSAESLTRAKEAIDAPEPKEKKPPFTRMKAYRSKYGKPHVMVEITSIAETGYGDTNVWIVEGKDREKVRLSELIAFSPENDSKLEELAQLRKQENELDNKASAIISSLAPVKIEV